MITLRNLPATLPLPVTTVPIAPTARYLYEKVERGTGTHTPPDTGTHTPSGYGITDMSGNLDWTRQLELLKLENAFNQAEAEKSRQWQERMSNTAFQRAAEDLKKAGFNPALLLGASGASTPSGATARSSSKSGTSTSANMASIYTTLLSSAFKLAGSLLGGLFS